MFKNILGKKFVNIIISSLGNIIVAPLFYNAYYRISTNCYDLCQVLYPVVVFRRGRSCKIEGATMILSLTVLLRPWSLFWPSMCLHKHLFVGYISDDLHRRPIILVLLKPHIGVVFILQP